jgi:protein SCO1/2
MPGSPLHRLASRASFALRAALALLVWSAAFGVHEAEAQRSGQQLEVYEGVGIDRMHGTVVPKDATFRNADGQRVRLGDYFDGTTPVLLNLVYHDCPMLCGLVLNGMTKTLSGMDWTPGENFRVLTVSFNHLEGPEVAREQREHYLAQLGRDGARDGWHFLTGDEAAIQALTQAVGFNFRWVEDQQEYAHPTAAIFLSGEGKVTRYIYGMEFPPSDVRQALVEASDGKVGNPVDQVRLFCFQFDPEANSYAADAFRLMQVGGTLTMLILGAGLYLFWRRERRDLDAAAERGTASGEPAMT